MGLSVVSQYTEPCDPRVLTATQVAPNPLTRYLIVPDPQVDIDPRYQDLFQSWGIAPDDFEKKVLAFDVISACTDGVKPLDMSSHAISFGCLLKEEQMPAYYPNIQKRWVPLMLC